MIQSVRAAGCSANAHNVFMKATAYPIAMLALSGLYFNHSIEEYNT